MPTGWGHTTCSPTRTAGRLTIQTMDNDNKRWTVVSSEYLIRRPWLTARRDHVRLPDGREIPEYYVLEYPDWINVIAITREGRYVMVRQYRHALGITSTELVAGVMEKGETPLQAAQRELSEETGYGKGTWSEIMTISANPSAMNNLTHCFIARDVEPVGPQHLDPNEDLTVEMLTREEVRGLLERDEVKQALMAAPLWKHFATMDRPATTPSQPH